VAYLLDCVTEDAAALQVEARGVLENAVAATTGLEPSFCARHES
jgi:hypothetical protein